MNKIINKQTKKIIIMILIVLLFNFVVPNYSKAGILLNLFANMLVFFPDALIQGLQGIVVGEWNIEVQEDVYSIKVSPGIIFSGKIPLLNINFIEPPEDEIVMTWDIELLLNNLIDNNRCYDKIKVSVFDIGTWDRSIKRKFKGCR